MAMALVTSVLLPQFQKCDVFGNHSHVFSFLPKRAANFGGMKVVAKAKARGNTRKENPKIRNRRMQKKFNGTPQKPRLSVFCSTKQLYAMLVDDQNKKCLFYGSTLQKSFRESPSCSTADAAEKLGEELIKACVDLNINELSSYDRNGFPCGDRMKAFEIAIARHGFLPN